MKYSGVAKRFRTDRSGRYVWAALVRSSDATATAAAAADDDDDDGSRLLADSIETSEVFKYCNSGHCIKILSTLAPAVSLDELHQNRRVTSE